MVFVVEVDDILNGGMCIDGRNFFGMYIRVSIFYFFRGFVLGVYGGYFGGCVNVVFFYCVLFY